MGVIQDASYGKLTDRGLSDRLARALSLVGPDYDYSKQIGSLDSRLHSSDYGKLPSHPTFSDQSYYSSDSLAGGQWGRRFTNDGKIIDTYAPSQQMIDAGLAKELGRYMKKIEPNVILLNPNSNWEPR